MIRFFFRKVFPVLVVLAALIGLFLLYNHYQVKMSVDAPTGGPTTLPAPVHVDTGSAAGTQIHPGTGSWFEQYDRVTGQRTYRFRADYYNNHPSGLVDVTNPVIEFFQPNGQIIHLEGVDGYINMPPAAASGMLSGAASEPPRSGVFNHVTCKIYSSEGDQANDLRQMTLTMDNAAFDNDTYSLFTKNYDNAAGQTILADQVPVKIVGKDYDFAGKGMVMYWNDPLKQLRSLEIAHGDYLTIHNTSAASFGPTTQNTVTSGTQKISTNVTPAVPGPAGPTTITPNGSQSPARAIAPTTATSPTTMPTAKPRYYATFYDNVRVYQGPGRQPQDRMILADKMGVDFALKSDDHTAGPTTAPSTQPTAPPPGAQTASAPSGIPASPPTSPQTPPANGDAKQDITVLWEGKLTIVPTPDAVANAEPLVPGNSIIHLQGTPVIVNGKPTTPDQPSTEVKCATLVYRSADSSVELADAPGVPLVITQRRPDGTGPTINAQHLTFSKLDHVAVLDGWGYAKFPDPNDPKTILNTWWSKKCVVELIPTTANQMQIKSAFLAGDVVVKHPRFDLKSNELVLKFDPAKALPGQPRGNPELRTMIATGDAHVVTHEAQGADRSIDSQRLQMDTADDPQQKLYAKTIHANGDVTARQQDQTLKCQDMIVELIPAVKKPGAPAVPAAAADDAQNVQLQTMLARDTVHVTGKDGASADCDKLLIEMPGGKEHVQLIGTPFAVVRNTGTTLWGPVIEIYPDDQKSIVEGAGTMHAIQQSTDPTKPGQPMDVWWKDGINVDGKANRIDVNGDVKTKSLSDDGSVNLSQSKRMVLMLEDKVPTTRPAQPAPTTKPAAVAGGDFNFMQNKQVKTIILLDSAYVESSLTAADGTLLKRFKLLGEEIDYAVDDHRLTVPVPGKMLAEQHGPPTTQPDAGTAPGGRGATAFQWDKDFVYDELKRQAVIDGNVTIVHRDDGPTPKQISITGDRVIADLQPVKDAPNAPPAAAGAAPRMQVTHLTVDGSVTVLTGDETINAGAVDYDPIGQVLICRSGKLGHVTVTDSQRRGGATFGEVWMNTKDNTLIQMTDLNAHSGG